MKQAILQRTPEALSVEGAASLCYQQGVNWSLPVIQTEEAHQSLVRLMMEHNISSAWLGWQNVQLHNWTWIDGQISKFIPVLDNIYTCRCI